MSETVPRPHRASVKNLLPQTKTLDALSQHRHVALAAGVLLMLVAAWCGWRQFDSPSTPAAGDEFVELDGFDAPAMPDFAENVAAVAPDDSAPLPEIVLPPWNNVAPASPAISSDGGSFVRFAMSQELSSPASTAEPPVSFVGTIEPADDATELPTWPTVTPARHSPLFPNGGASLPGQPPSFPGQPPSFPGSAWERTEGEAPPRR